jgi:hypothetical protein
VGEVSPIRKGTTRPKSVGALEKERAEGKVKRKQPPKAKVIMSPTATGVLLGDDDVSDWDDEELLMGRRRDKNGHFTGAEPRVIPKAVHDELIRRTTRKAQAKFQEMQDDALEALQAIVTGADVDDKDRLKAVEMVLNRTIGRAPEKVEVTAHRRPWEDIVEGVEFVTDDDEADTDADD